MTPDLHKMTRQLADNLIAHRRVYGGAWPSMMAEMVPAIELSMRCFDTDNPIAATLPTLKRMSDEGKNPMMILAAATEMFTKADLSHA